MEEANKSVAESHLLHHFHSELVVVSGDVCCIVDRSKLVLSGSNLVVLSLCEDTELPELAVEVSHVLGNSRLDGAEVVVIHFLTLGRHCTEERASCHNKILALLPHLTVNEKVLLLGSD